MPSAPVPFDPDTVDKWWEEERGGGLGVGAIIGIIVGVIVVFMIFRRVRARGKQSD